MTLSNRRQRQVLSAVAVGALLVPTANAVSGSGGQPIAATLVFSTCIAALLVIAAFVLSSLDARRLARLDIATLVTGLVAAAARFIGVAHPLGASDVTQLNKLAMASVMQGVNPYTQVYAQVGANGGGTPLLTGGQVNTYAYPPFTLEIGRALGTIDGRLASPAVVGLLGVFVIAIGMFFAVPPSWRPLVLIVVLGIGFEVPQAQAGNPVVMAGALLAGALFGWSRIGRGGRLGWRGAAQAVLLGLAAASHQLTWFVAAFLFVALALLRFGELPGRRATGVLARYAGIVVAVFLAANSPFLISNPSVWLRRMGETLTQQAIVFGSSWTLPVLEVRGGSERLSMLTYATVLLFAALLLIYAVGFRRLAAAVVVLPSLAFLFSTRSNTEYFLAFVPLWLVAVAGADPRDVAQAKVLPLPRMVSVSGVRQGLVAGLLVLPAIACYGVGLTGRPPVTLQPIGLIERGGRLQRLMVDVTNNTERTVRPIFYVDHRSAITHPWRCGEGNVVLRPDQTALVSLQPWTSNDLVPARAGYWVFATLAGSSGVSAGFAAQPIDLLASAAVHSRG